MDACLKGYGAILMAEAMQLVLQLFIPLRMACQVCMRIDCLTAKAMIA